MDGGADHHWAVVLVLLQGVEQGRGETKVALHKLLGVLRAVYSCKIKDEVAVLAPLVKLLGRGVDVVLINGINLQVAILACLAFLYVIELGTKVSSYETFGPCNENLHIILNDSHAILPVPANPSLRG